MSAGLAHLTRTALVPAPHVLRLRFGQHDRITIGGLHYTHARYTDGGHILNRVDLPAVFEDVSHDEMWMLSNRRDWRIDPEFYSPKKVIARSEVGTEELSDLVAKEIPDVVWKWEWCCRIIRLFESGEILKNEEGMALAIKRINEDMRHLDVSWAPPKPKKGDNAKPRKRAAGSKIKTVLREPPGERTLFRWLAILEERGHSPVHLRDGRYRSGCRTPQIVGEALLALVKHGQRYASDARPKIRDLHRNMKAEIDGANLCRSPDAQIACPSKAALGLYIAGLGKFYVYSRRYTLERAKRKFAIITSGVVVTRPFERIEIDSWKVDLQSILTVIGLWDRLDGKTRHKVKRMHFCAAIDVASKVIVGARLSASADTAAAVAVVRMAVTDKRAYADAAGAVLPWNQCARLEGINSDGGSQFNNPIFIGKVAALGVSPNFPSGGVPSLRGTMESFFRTVGHQLIARLPGKTFENVIARGDYDSKANACIDTETLARLLTRWIVDAYHGQPHDGLAGETPHDAWIRLTGMFGVSKAPDRHKIRSIFGIPLERTLGNGGIRVLGLRYWCEPLVEHFKHHGNVDMEVKLDPEDLGEVAVRIGNAWHVATCVREGFEDVTLETWIRASRDLAHKHAAGAALTQHAVSAAIREAGILTREAMDRAGISAVQATVEDIDRAEREIMQGWTMPDADAAEPASERGDPLDRGIPVTGPDDRPPTLPEFDDFEIEL
ncbi:Mu transposase C-terminal domain-containing protein [Methylobacterium sp. Leaf106]|uniref:Mu transposase C-terminal domain-containing protein n=1 Tax=Methylobacterium sp. Leaf106 TaxID=1736255 RepID=UPI0006FE50BD|nr:Mu transposase C-terminal domain-containing protein [Methylobacterium sp. Leaf106]KQP52818.1 hypothetical protein ASF34_00030 [Methylobacterium sp. Leaf106]